MTIRWAAKIKTVTDAGFVQYFNGLIGCAFVVLAALHTAEMSKTCWITYACAALLAFVSLKPNLNVTISRVLAVLTTLLMFGYFAMFFMDAPDLEGAWYREGKFWEAISRLIAAFCLIPVLSDYSCRLKGERCERLSAKRRAFFSIPHHLH